MSENYKRLLFFCVLVLFPFVVKAANLENVTIKGNVFLKGKYVQIGINPNGALGTVPLKYESLSPEEQTNLRLFATTE